jgi:hypothetical protein
MNKLKLNIYSITSNCVNHYIYCSKNKKAKLMKRTILLTLFSTSLIFSTTLQAQKVNLFPTENFNGKFVTVNQPIPQLKGDPWIFQVYSELYGRKPNAWELNIKNYNKGSWNSYDQLKGLVKDYQSYLAQQKIEIRTGGYNGNVIVGFFRNGRQYAVNVVAAGGANVVAAGGANVVAAGGANVVAAGGANLVAHASLAAVTPGER